MGITGFRKAHTKHGLDSEFMEKNKLNLFIELYTGAVESRMKGFVSDASGAGKNAGGEKMLPDDRWFAAPLLQG